MFWNLYHIIAPHAELTFRLQIGWSYWHKLLRELLYSASQFTSDLISERLGLPHMHKDIMIVFKILPANRPTDL